MSNNAKVTDVLHKPAKVHPALPLWGFLKKVLNLAIRA
jgi:hypothetical protein